MILCWLIGILLVAGVLAAVAARWSATAARWISLIATAADFAIVFFIWVRSAGGGFIPAPGPSGAWIEQADRVWIPQFGIHFHLAVDGLSLLLLALTFLLGALSVVISWKEIDHSVGFFHLNLLWILAGVAGVFMALDLFLFYFAWELMLVPMYFLISLWGHERRVYAAVKFFLFTQLSGLLMLIAILTLYFRHYQATGIYTFQYGDLLNTPMPAGTAFWVMLGFFTAFAVKLPLFPFHVWLPDAHTEAPTAGSVILAGLLLKTGAYGMIRFVVPLFPDAAREFAPVAMALGVVGILYGAVLAFAQNDMKRLVAYTSVSHLGFVVLGVFSWNPLGLQGAVMTMLCHGISTGALFMLAGVLQERLHTRDMDQMSGLWDAVPRLSGVALFFALGSLGLPGLGDFAGEFLVLLGTYREWPIVAILGSVGVLCATFYALRMVQRAFHGPNRHHWSIRDLMPREGIVMGILAASLLWLGLNPQPVLNTFDPALRVLQTLAAPQVARR